MPGAGRSNSSAVRGIGALVALIAVVGYLFFGWSFNGSTNTIPTAIGIIVAVTAIGWTLYRRIYLDWGRNNG
jgi:cobalamin biosynthesis protein CobD/CbiB